MNTLYQSYRKVRLRNKVRFNISKAYHVMNNPLFESDIINFKIMRVISDKCTSSKLVIK